MAVAGRAAKAARSSHEGGGAGDRGGGVDELVVVRGGAIPLGDQGGLATRPGRQGAPLAPLVGCSASRCAAPCGLDRLVGAGGPGPVTVPARLRRRASLASLLAA